jgi:hypothetical protein
MQSTSMSPSVTSLKTHDGLTPFPKVELQAELPLAPYSAAASE